MTDGDAMKKLLEEIREIIHFVTQAVYYYRKQNYAKAHMAAMAVINIGEQYFNDAENIGFDESANLLLPIWKELLEATENGDEIQLADIYENQLMPALFEIQSCFIDALDDVPVNYWDENLKLLKEKDIVLYEKLNITEESKKREYFLNIACTGDAVLSVNTSQYGNVMLSSFINPWQEALIYADGMAEKTGNRCIILGLGMGYHAKYIALSSYFKEIVILESDLEQLRICMMYTDMRSLLSDQHIKIVFCDKVSDYTSWLKDGSGNFISVWYPSVKTIENNALRELLENYCVNISSADNLENILLYNFERNQELGDEPVENIKDRFKGKDIVIAGAGPSLDENFDYLRKISSKSDVNVVCVGKAARRLISQNINPGYIVMIDGKEGTRWQTSGIEDCGVPLIYLSTVAYNVASEYNGKRYIAYQEGIEPSKEYAEKNNLTIYQSGGSVATFAIDLAVRMECSRVICVGLDMGYIGDNTHAEGIGRKISGKKSLRKVESSSGGEIYTSKTLDIYRRWIERRIENVENIEFINASGGAKIHGMQEKSLKEINSDYCHQKIYCYVEDVKDEMDKFISEHNDDSLVEIFLSIIDSCEGQLIYCLCDIANNYIKSDKKLWFVTDVKGLYDVVEKFYSFLFEKIIYIEQGNKKEFKGGIKTASLINYFISIQKDEQQASLMKKLWELRNSGTLEEIIRELAVIGDNRIANIEKEDKFWCCFCQLILYVLEEECSGKDYFYYKLALYSIIIMISNSSRFTKLYLEEVLSNDKTSLENLYFVYHQFKRFFFTGQAIHDNESKNMLDELYNRCYNGFLENDGTELVKIPLEERNHNLVIIMTVQFLNDIHAPTKSVIERIKALRALGKNVVLVNTAEFCLMNGYLPIYKMDVANFYKEYNEISEFKIENENIPFLQLPDDLPIPYRLQALTQIITKLKPYYIISVGTGSILADLCGNMVPCASMSVVFSSLPQTKNKMKILGRELSAEEKEIYKEEDIIESRFTFELKPQTRKFSRKEQGIPEDKFVLVVVGTRLDYDITDEFMEMLQQVCENGCYVIFSGIMDNYNMLMERYPVVAGNSLFAGYCEDILALMEICDLYVNPDRYGGGFSVIEAFSKGKPGVYLKKGDVYTAGGEDFAVGTFDDMAEQIIKYKEDLEYYNSMSAVAKDRARLMTSSKEAMADLDRQICQRIEEKYW